MSVAKTPGRDQSTRRDCITDRKLIRPRTLKRPIIAAVVVACLGLGACVDTAVRTAPFRQRPDSADAGDLSGPFTGRVLDNTTHSAIAGALI